MPRPDLGDPRARSAYRAELRALYRGWRVAGLSLLVAALAIAWLRGGADLLVLAMAGAGAAIIVAVIGARTLYHRRRMSEPAEGRPLA